jgi:hypothetical protein
VGVEPKTLQLGGSFYLRRDNDVCYLFLWMIHTSIVLVG